MTAPSYVLDDRSAAGVLAELRLVAASIPVPGLPPPAAGLAPKTWADLLFEPGGELVAGEPSAALLAALVELYPGLLDHLNALPERALVDWLQRRLGIPRLPVVPDRVVAVPTPDPKKLPVVVPGGTLLRGGRDTAGNERRYATTETLSVLGSQLFDVRSYRNAPEGESLADWPDPSAPFEPFPDGAVVPHHVDFVTDVIAFSGGSLKVNLTFKGAGTRSLPAGLIWQYSTPEKLEPVVSAKPTGNSVDLVLAGGCGALVVDGVPRTFLRASLPDSHPRSAFDFKFTSVEAAVIERTYVVPDAGFFNDGVLDISKEFQPFGPVAKRGDSFYIKSDEAFSKAVTSLTVRLEMLGEGVSQMYEVAWGGGIPTFIKAQMKSYKETSSQTKNTSNQKMTKEQALFFDYLDRAVADTGDARVEWQRFDGTAWQEFASTDDVLKTLVVKPGLGTVDGSHHSLPFTVAGVHGRMIRAFLDRGDFGWSAYQQRIANFAAEAAKKVGGNPDASDLIPPDPPVVSRVTLDYTTSPRPITELVARDGWSTRRLGAGDTLFALPLAPDADTDAAAAIAFGLELPPSALGSTVSLYVDVAPAAACSTSDAIPVVIWEYWSADRWRPLDEVDETAGLRQGGLLRFIAPADWSVGCRDLSADGARWIRARTNLPDRLGTMRAVIPDAVVAEYRSQLPDPADDASPEIPLTARALKGMTVPIDGIKKFTNPLPGLMGRGPEPDDRYVTRAAQWPRHRNRAIQAWDYEAIVAAEFPEVATIRCLPHTGVNDEISPGSVGLVIVPWSDEPQPYPSVTLAERIGAALRPRLPVHARPVVLCPIYVEVSVDANAVLRPGFSASEAKRTLGAAIDGYLHPAADAPFGRELFASTMVRFLESRPEIDHVTDFGLIADPCPPTVTTRPCRVERVTVDPCRGLVASSGVHLLDLQEQL